jgi:hypothetical protein
MRPPHRLRIASLNSYCRGCSKSSHEDNGLGPPRRAGTDSPMVSARNDMNLPGTDQVRDWKRIKFGIEARCGTQISVIGARKFKDSGLLPAGIIPSVTRICVTLERCPIRARLRVRLRQNITSCRRGSMPCRRDITATSSTDLPRPLSGSSTLPRNSYQSGHLMKCR